MRGCRSIKKYGIYMLCICCLIAVTACGKKKEEKRPHITGQAEGTVDFTGETPKIDIGNIFAYINQEIDYTSGLKLLLGDAYYEVQVDASSVQSNKPGTYDVEYTFQYGNNTYLNTIQVTIVDEGTYNSSAGELVNDTKTEQNTEGNQAPTNQGDVQSGETSEETKEEDRELVTNPEDNVWEKEELQNVKIELLSGKVITVMCTTERYIISTTTEKNTLTRQNKKYEISKLVVKFSNGDRQVLETIEKKID